MDVELDRPQETFVVVGRYTESMVQQAVREFIVRRALRKWDLWAVEIFLIALAIYMGRDGEDFWCGIATAGALVPGLIFVVMWRAHWVNTVGKFRKMRDPEAIFTFEETSLSVRSSEGEARIPLSRIVEVWQLEGFWMLFLAENQFMTLPIGQVDEDTMRMLQARLPISK